MVVFPEFALLIGAFRRLCRPDRFAGREYRKILVREFHLVRFDVIVLELALRAKRKSSATWSLKIRKLGERNDGIRVPGGSATRRHIRW